MLAPIDETFELASRPGAAFTIYLDFTGPRVEGTAWNQTYANGEAIEAPPFDIESESAAAAPGLVTAASIQTIWSQTAAYFEPWDVNVTTAEPEAEDLRMDSADDPRFGTRVIFTGPDILSPDCGCRSGVAFVDIWRSPEASQAEADSWVFTDLAGTGITAARIAAHEVGHNFGLRHDGRLGSEQSPSLEYAAGAAPWSPIMGAPTFLLAQWSRGEYWRANQTEDDLAIISRTVNPLPDDYPDGVSGENAGGGAEDATPGEPPTTDPTSDPSGSASDDPTAPPSTTSVPSTTLVPLRPGASLGGLIGLTYTSTGERLLDVDMVPVKVSRRGRFKILVKPNEKPGPLDVRISLLRADGAVLGSASRETDERWSYRLAKYQIHGVAASLRLTLEPGAYLLAVQGDSQGDPQSRGFSAYGALGTWRASMERVRRR